MHHAVLLCMCTCMVVYTYTCTFCMYMYLPMACSCNFRSGELLVTKYDHLRLKFNASIVVQVDYWLCTNTN